jgi:hypothetical protein
MNSNQVFYGALQLLHAVWSNVANRYLETEFASPNLGKHLIKVYPGKMLFPYITMQKSGPILCVENWSGSSQAAMWRWYSVENQLHWGPAAWSMHEAYDAYHHHGDQYKQETTPIELVYFWVLAIDPESLLSSPSSSPI